ncbi:hypothetical protein PBAC_04420 [Pedobacter glucosidilyticus]|nr:hypothetical protein PBAC_04420 [Pedobacter glucosidilyticus]
MCKLDPKKHFYFRDKNFRILHVYAIFIEMMQRGRNAVVKAITRL